VFDALGADGTAIYHTNVLLSIGSRWAVIGTDAIVSADRARVLQRLRTDRDVIEISLSAMAQFGANVLELRSAMPQHAGQRVLVLSERAQAAFQQLDDAWNRLNGAVDRVLPVAVTTIENVGGGGVRCMLAEVPEVTT
jgi:hypothetical protein